MFNQYNYKQKFSALIVVFFLLLITAYKRSFSQLIASYKEYNLLINKKEEFTKKSLQLNKIKEDVSTLDQILGKGGLPKEQIQQEIIQFIAQNHPDVTIDHIQPIHHFQDESFDIVTHIIDLTANTNQLLNTIYNFEKQFETSKIISLQFYTTVKNDQEEKLHLKLIFQNYEGI
ncbi:hypothetical protein [Flavobacterium oreochromis]|uniref:General secretion pathway protein n=2 Tax=Flavobacterium TaxID=237 RepID=A0A246G7L2_9FLAO|nr:hypothetical protein [Flavobacterium oreochromis]OWP74528.1 hypothetical protein BWK62_14125 [Flavobacterium oreochromis]OWP74768.1 hypothetical protein BWG23_13005 [Flavobacterium oreochromis]POR23160.1 hypothetical protein BWK58_10215 [Flavobacterium columnare]QYS87060.1 hypothetical protein JJC03_03575 [Flavobacterium oreochromis]